MGAFRIAACLALGIVFGLLGPSPAGLAGGAGTVFYVSPEGRDTWTGRAATPRADRMDGPFATITRARDAIRALPAEVRARSPITVFIRGGRYELAEPVTFTPEDSGRREAPITYAAYEGERPVLSGGRRLTGWLGGPGATWRLQVPGAADGSWYFRQLFVNDRRAQRARTPDVGFFRVNGDISPGPPVTFPYRKGDIDPMWQTRRDVEVVALQAWAEFRLPIIQTDSHRRTVTLAGRCAPANREPGARYWIENAIEALDTPGEWFLDTGTGRLTYWPMQGEEMLRTEVVAPALTQLVRISGGPTGGTAVGFLRFRRLGFAHTDWTLPAEGYADVQAAYDIPAAFEVSGAHDIVVDGCSFRHLGGYALAFDRGCRGNTVTGCEIADAGAGGVKIGEPVIRRTAAEQTGGNVISGNDIHHLGLVYPGAVGVWIGQSGDNTIRRNHIHNTYSSGIWVGWTWGYGESAARGNVIEQNHVHHVGQAMLSGVGGITTMGVQPGTVIRGNVVHDIDAYGSGGWGISLGEGSSNVMVEGNVVYRTKSGGFYQHSGRENVVRNNVFAFSRGGQLARAQPEAHLGFTFEHNIVYWKDGSLLDGDWSGNGYRFDQNVYFQTDRKPVIFSDASLKEWRARGQDVHSRIADPRFVAATRGDFRLKAESPALGAGFHPIILTVPSLVAPRE